MSVRDCHQIFFRCPNPTVRAVGQLLLRAARTGDGADVDTPEYDGMTPLMTAARHGHAVVVVLLASNATISLVCSQYRTALYYAIHYGHLDVVKRLIAARADPDHASDRLFDETAIMVAAAAGHVDVFEFFSTMKPRSVYDTNDSGKTAHHYASRCGQLHMVEWLLALGVAPDHANPQRWTPLLEASKHGHAHIVETLLCTGRVDVNRTTLTGESALFFAAMFGHVDVVEILLARGARVNVVARKGQSILHANSNVRVLSTFAAAGAEMDIADQHGLSALLRGAELGHIYAIHNWLASPLADVTAAVAMDRVRCSRSRTAIVASWRKSAPATERIAAASSIILRGIQRSSNVSYLKPGGHCGVVGAGGAVVVGSGVP